jgi:Mannosyltransferase (PIG-V)
MQATTPLPGSVPWWVQVLDFLAIACVILAVMVISGGGFRMRVGDVRLSFMSPVRLALWATALIALRHVAWRRVALHERIASGARRALASEGIRACWPIFVGTRAAVLVVGFFAIFLLEFGLNPVPFRSSHNEFANLPARWDAGWYLGIATDGYYWDGRADRQQNIAFFPAFPMLMRTLGLMLGGSPVAILWAGVLISHAAFLWALVYLYRLAREPAIGATREQAASAAILLAAYPYAVFFSAPYTESLFLLATVGAVFHFMRREWWAAAMWALLAGLCRPNGCFLSVPLALLAAGQFVQARRAGQRVHDAFPALAAAAMPGVGMLLFSAHVYALTGNPLQWSASHAAWGRTFKGLGALTLPLDYLQFHGFQIYMRDLSYDALNMLGVLFALALTVPVWRRLGAAFAILVLVNLVPPLLLGGVLSLGRVSATLFPLFLWLGLAVPERHRPAWTAAFAMGQGLVAALFYTWRPFF